MTGDADTDATSAQALARVQDLTELDYSAHQATTGLGPLGDNRKQGFLLQSALAVLPATKTAN